MMDAGIRPKGSFIYAALRYKEERPACHATPNFSARATVEMIER